MQIFRLRQGERREYDSLWRALDLDERLHNVVSFVGAGGKTSLMFAMAEEAAAKGYSVIVTTTTKIYKPTGYPVVLAETAMDFGTVVKKGSVVVAGRYHTEEKLKGLPESELGDLLKFGDLLLIEADGARRLPLKFPGDREPVLVPQTRAVIGCAGLDSMGQRFCDGCFRFERAKEVLSLKPDSVITPEVLGAVLSGSEGTAKGTGGMEYRTVLNKLDLVEEESAFAAARETEKRTGQFCVLTSLRQEGF